MGSETTPRLPMLDFSGHEIKPGTVEWCSLRTQVRRAIEEYGCFEARFDRISRSEIGKTIFESLEELFDLPLETKMKNVSEKPHHGYGGQFPSLPLYESMGIDDANMFQNVHNFTQTMWPQGNTNFSDNIYCFTQQVTELDTIMRRMIFESFGIEKYIDEHMKSTSSLLRFMKYEGIESKTKMGLNCHTDKNMLTILYQNKINGLEIQTKDGEWIHIKPSVGSFVVMVGDTLYAYLNGGVHSPYHRVLMSGKETRYSIGSFVSSKGGEMIKAPKERIDENNPLLFKPFDYIEFLEFFCTKEGLAARSALKTFCGV